MISKATADYFVFLIYILEESKDTGRMLINPHTITIPIKALKAKALKFKKNHGDRYSFYIWVNHKKKEAFDFRDKTYDLSQYLDKKGFEGLERKLNI